MRTGRRRGERRDEETIHDNWLMSTFYMHWTKFFTYTIPFNPRTTSFWPLKGLVSSLTPHSVEEELDSGRFCDFSKGSSKWGAELGLDTFTWNQWNLASPANVLSIVQKAQSPASLGGGALRQERLSLSYILPRIPDHFLWLLRPALHL